MKSIPAGKFIMLCLSCKILGSYRPLMPYRGYGVICHTNSEAYNVERYGQRLGLTLEPERLKGGT